MMGVTLQQFDQAKDRLSSLKKDPGNEVKLQIYALFKQATQGPCNTPKPGMLDFVNKVKWDAWKSLGSVSQDEARQQYCDLIGSLVAAEGGSSAHVAARPAGSGPAYETLLETEDDITTITLNRPGKKNAITTEMYNDIIAALDQAAKDDSVITVFTGSGDFYCSGNDLSNFTQIPEGGVEESAPDGEDPAQVSERLQTFIQSLLHQSQTSCWVIRTRPAAGSSEPDQLLGHQSQTSCWVIRTRPAVETSATSESHPFRRSLNSSCVTRLLTEKSTETSSHVTTRRRHKRRGEATFHTPFSQLGQSAEGCSSYTFPKIMGPAKASEMLLFNKKLSAVQACELGLVTEVFPDSSFQSEVWTRLKVYAKLPPKSLSLSKQLVRSVERDRLHAVNDAEVELLKERWTSDECFNAVMAFFQAKL
ncbi:LOW QUALITY PROTEIN: enoyl-CoA delta isomerase 2 [Lycodopsis pacificus]